jgi:hypothetical protein
MTRRNHPSCTIPIVSDAACVAEHLKTFKGGKATFVKTDQGVCHVRCAPKETKTMTPLRTATNFSNGISTSISKRFEQPPTTAPANQTKFPRFGGSTSCPGCLKAVSPMEWGVVPGPSGTRWHSACLSCGGKNRRGRSGRRNPGEPGCGKKLDSAAKSDPEGGVWCRECWVRFVSCSGLQSANNFIASVTPFVADSFA